MKLCYCLTSDAADAYAEMTFISASAARRLHPDAAVELLVDELTARSLADRGARILGLADRVVTVPTGLAAAAARSRAVKTRMRELVAGPFLFLDADTLPVRRFDRLFAVDAPVAAALDRNHVDPDPHFPAWAGELLAAAGWRTPLPRYYNSGVVLFNDRPEAHAFGAEWHRRWRELHDRFGEHRDQPAFNSAADALGTPVAVLPVADNAMVHAADRFGRSARVLHYYTDRGRPRERTVLAHLVRHLAEYGEVDWTAVAAARRGVVNPSGLRWEFYRGRYARVAGMLAGRAAARVRGRVARGAGR